MESLITHFDAAYVINLPERTDRLKSVRNEFARARWDFDSLHMHVFRAHRFDGRGTFPSAAVRGCFQSHMDCLSEACRTGAESVLVMEDDIALSSQMPRVTAQALETVHSQTWDFLYFGHDDTGDIPLLTSAEPSLRFLPYVGAIKGAHFYAVRKRVLGRLVEHLKIAKNGVEGDQEFGPMPIDGAFNIFRWKNPDVQTLISAPKLGWQRASRSDISPREFDRFKILRPAIAAIRNLKSVMMRRSSN